MDLCSFYNDVINIDEGANKLFSNQNQTFANAILHNF